jgi:hypothetical protein
MVIVLVRQVKVDHLRPLLLSQLRAMLAEEDNRLPGLA